MKDQSLRMPESSEVFIPSIQRQGICGDPQECTEFKTSTEAVDAGIHPDKTKILSNQGKEKTKEITVDNTKIEVLSKGDSARDILDKK